MSLFKCFVVISILSAFAYAQRSQIGPCKDVKLVKNFDFERYSGHWYEFATTPYQFEDGQKCTEFYYSSAGNNNLMRMIKLYVDENDGRKYNYTRIIKFNKETGEGVTSNGYAFRLMDTDYESYAVLYGCLNMIGRHKEITWLLTRQRQPVEETIKAARKVAIQNGINVNKLKGVDQKDCPNNYDGAENV